MLYNNKLLLFSFAVTTVAANPYHNAQDDSDLLEAWLAKRAAHLDSSFAGQYASQLQKRSVDLGLSDFEDKLYQRASIFDYDDIISQESALLRRNTKYRPICNGVRTQFANWCATSCVCGPQMAGTIVLDPSPSMWCGTSDETSRCRAVKGPDCNCDTSRKIATSFGGETIA